jgi:hypothetical protein
MGNGSRFSRMSVSWPFGLRKAAAKHRGKLACWFSNWSLQRRTSEFLAVKRVDAVSYVG